MLYPEIYDFSDNNQVLIRFIHRAALAVHHKGIGVFFHFYPILHIGAMADMLL